MVNRQAMLLMLLFARSVHAQSPAELKTFLATNARTPEAYVLSKFANHDLVLIGEPHWVRQHVTLVGGLIPQLQKRGVNILAIEFARRIDQALIDSILNAPVYDEKLARRVTMQGLVQWGYQEYVDLYKAAWQVNRARAPGAERFRILALNGSPDYGVFKKREDLDDWKVRRVVLHGETEKDWATLLIDSVLAKNQKALVYSGLHHAFTKYAQPIVSDGKLVRKEDSRFGQYLYAYAPARIFMIALHGSWPGEAGYDAPPVLPADGRIDEVLESTGQRWQRAGFDLNGTPFGMMVSRAAVYKHGYEPFTMDQFADGYVYVGPIWRYESVTPIADFIDESNLQYARANSSSPADRTASIADFNRGIVAMVESAKGRWRDTVTMRTSSGRQAAATDSIPRHATPQNRPCATQPRSLSALRRAHSQGRAPTLKELQGSWVLIGTVAEPASVPVLNCSGVKRGGVFEWMITIDGDSMTYDAVGYPMPAERHHVEWSLSGDLRLSPESGADYAEQYSCRLTTRGTLACIERKNPRGHEFSRQPAPSSLRISQYAPASGCQAIPATATILDAGAFSNVRLTEEHGYGYIVMRWKADACVFGLFTSVQGSAGDAPIGLIQDVKYDQKMGNLSFNAKLSMGAVSVRGSAGQQPSHDLFAFRANLKRSTLAGVIAYSLQNDPQAQLVPETLTLSLSRGEREQMHGSTTYGEWNSRWQRILRLRGPKW